MVDGEIDPAEILRGPQPEREPDLSRLNGYIPRADVTAAMLAHYKPPTPFMGLIYSGRVHTLSGPPEAGKTILGLWLALKAMQRGNRVLMLDEETGLRQTADILNSMGADPEMIRERLYYSAFNDMPWKGDDIDHLAMLLEEWKPRLSIFDSAGELLSSAGIDENNPTDVTRFYKLVLRPVASKFRSSVLLIDHDAKEGSYAKGPSRYSRGTTAKLAVPDVMIKLTQLRPFSRSQDGVLGLYVAKDRLGAMHRHYRIRVTSQPLDMEFTRTTAADQTEGGSGMSPAAEKVLDVLTEVPVTTFAINDAIAAKFGNGLRRETMSRALNALAEQQLADKMDMGPGRSALWCKHGVNTMEAPPPPASEGG